MSFQHEIQKSIDFIEENISINLNLEELSSLIHYSKFYYHRVFHAAVGEPVSEYIRKRRLTNAVRKLMETDCKILDIALECGYNSQIAFTSAFKKAYGITPGQCRKNKAPVTFYEKICLDGREFGRSNFSMTLGPRIISGEELKVVGIKYSTTEDYIQPKVVRDMWHELDCRAPEIKGRVNPNTKIGNCFYDENARRLTYIACYQVKEITGVLEGMVSKTMPESRYAVFTHRGTFEKNSYTLGYIFDTWLSNNEYMLDNEIGLVERFTRSFSDTEGSLLEIGIAIK